MDPESIELSIILPAYNEEENIERALAAATKVGERLCARHEILVVDDGSRDRTAELVRAAGRVDPRIQLISHETNRGYGHALRSGFSAATMDLVFFTDADNQFDLEELEAFLPSIEHADVVAGFRLNRQDPFIRRFFAKGWNAIVRVLFYAPVRDIDCAFKLFRRDVFKDISLEAMGAMVSTELMVRLARSGKSVIEIGVTHYPRTAGRARGADPRVILRALIELRSMYVRLRAAGYQDTRSLRRAGVTSTDRSGLAETYFDVMAEHARSHWWYLARAAWVRQELVGRALGGTAVDVGCGVGANTRALGEAGYDAVLGLDVSQYVLQRARGLGGLPLLAVASAEHLPVGDDAVRCVASLDVIEHLPDDVGALREYSRAVEPGGTMLLMVPAYQWLFSDHDRWAGHQRRYSAKRLVAAVEAAGLRVERTTYLFSFLVPAAILLRRTPLRRWLGRTDEETSSVSPTLNRMFTTAGRVERWAARRVRIPFGLSVLVVATVQSPTSG